MAKTEQSDGFWPRMIITMVVVTWAAILFGSWIGHKIVDKQRQGDTASQELNIPDPKPRPWRTADPRLQKELEDQRQGLDKSGKTPSRTVTASPVAAQASPKAAQSPQAPESPQAAESPQAEESPDAESSPVAQAEPKPAVQTPAPTPEKTAAPSPAASAEGPVPTPEANAAAGYQLQFGSFSKEEYAKELAEKLAAEGQDARIEAIQTENGTFYRVRGGDYSDETAARSQADRLRGAGIDVYVVNH